MNRDCARRRSAAAAAAIERGLRGAAQWKRRPATCAHAELPGSSLPSPQSQKLSFTLVNGTTPFPSKHAKASSPLATRLSFAFSFSFVDADDDVNVDVDVVASAAGAVASLTPQYTTRRCGATPRASLGKAAQRSPSYAATSADDTDVFCTDAVVSLDTDAVVS
jgi:hypothetical protein